ncbi:hypothetical protein SUGI_1422310, partial [Cryptomeria japonica]
PNITAPGVDILAAWSNAAPVSMDLLDKRVVDFNIISGIAMTCHHATGAAAYVMSFHPDKSPVAIKSALMTTDAYPFHYPKNLYIHFIFLIFTISICCYSINIGCNIRWQ